MSVKVLFFGATADIVGTRQSAVNAAGRSVAELRETLLVDHPKLASHRLLLAINQEYSPDDTRLTDGDEVAIFTAVSGG